MRRQPLCQWRFAVRTMTHGTLDNETVEGIITFIKTARQRDEADD
jgi:hypothetical protein